MVGVAQLVRAPDCGSGGRGFDSHHSPANLFYEPLAQVVEHLTFNQVVPGSSPGWLTKIGPRNDFRGLFCNIRE